jgi:uncharacterized membrane protein YphA (DoxX/SURF4 family)
MKLSTKRARGAALVTRLGLGAVFAFAAVPKAIDPAGFAADIAAYHVVPGSLVGLLAVALPLLELTVAAALLFGIEARGASVVAAGMLVAFTIGMVQAMARGIDLECGCFGAATETAVSTTTVARNVGLLLVATFGAFAPETPWVSSLLGRGAKRSP